MNSKTIFKKAAFAALACGSMLVASIPQSAQAGWNGQQLEIHVPYHTSVEVTGKNQAGNTVTWKKSGSNRFTTSGLWWKGTVTIKTSNPTHPDYGNWTCTRYVPTVWASNTYSVKCPDRILAR